MRRRSRNRRNPGDGFGFNRLRPKTSTLRLSLAALLIAVGGWLILTRSLPIAIAESDTETALWLSSNHPAPQLVRARQLREQLFRNIANNKPSEATPKPGTQPSNQAQFKASKKVEQESLKARISELSKRVLSTEPLNGTAYRMLGEVAADPNEVRDFMKKAVARSRRESIAVYWLMNDSATQGDFTQALVYADILLRTRRELTPYVVSYMAYIAESKPAGFEQLISLLSTNPTWRAEVLSQLLRAVKDPRTPLRIIEALKEQNSPVVAQSYEPYLRQLIAKRQAPLAYATWLQLQTSEQLKSVSLINDGGFEKDVRNALFGWQIGRSQNALTVFESHKSRAEGRAFRTIFGSGQVRFSGPRQIVVLAPGVYELTGEAIGKIKAKRGLKWEVRCIASKSLAQSKSIVGDYPVWTKFSFTFVVPNSKGCSGQEVRLEHTARSASEAFVSGEIWFDNLKISRQAATTATSLRK
jgi:hypothetical protein